MLKNTFDFFKVFFIKHADKLFPLSFVFSFCLNLCFFYLGLAFEENAVRALLFLAVNILFAVVCGLCFLFQWRHSRFSLRSLLPLVLVMLYYIAAFALAAGRYGFRQPVVPYAEQFIVFCIPALMAGFIAGQRGAAASFFRTLEAFSFAVLPGALMYLNAILARCLPWNYGANLGILGYMNLAYTFMPFLLAHLIQFTEKDTWTVFLSSREVRRPQLWRLVFIAVYWLAIIASATRGTMVCVLVFCCALVLLRVLQRRGKAASLVSAAMAAVLLFNLFVYAPAGFYRLDDMRSFLSGLTRHELVTSKDSPDTADKLDGIVAQDSDKQVINTPPENPPEQPPENPPEQPSENPSEEPAEDYGAVKIGNRGTLFKLALMEFKKSPLTGMGPTAYSVKYGMYPHSVALEVLCETGIVGAIVLFGLLLYAVVLMALRARREPKIWLVLVFLLAYGIKANISACLWTCSALLGALGYGFGLTASPSEETEAPSAHVEDTVSTEKV